MGGCKTSQEILREDKKLQIVETTNIIGERMLRPYLSFPFFF